MKTDIKSMTLAEIKEAFRQEGLPAFRSLQVYRWQEMQGNPVC